MEKLHASPNSLAYFLNDANSNGPATRAMERLKKMSELCGWVSRDYYRLLAPVC
jgi:hypothetical protein